MNIKPAGRKSLIILLTVLALFICGSAFAAPPKDKAKPEIKLPVFKNAKDIKFDADDQKFFVWLNEFFPGDAGSLAGYKNNPKEYPDRFRSLKSQYRRLWKGYKENKDYGKALVVELNQRNERKRILDLYNARVVKSTTDKEYKAKLRGDLTNVVSKEFDIAMVLKKHKYEHLRIRIKTMPNYLAKRENEIKQLVEHKDVEVKKRVEALLKEGKVDPNRKHPKNKGIAPKKNAGVKLPVFKERKFNEDGQKFYVWLYEFFPNHAQDLKDLEKNPKEFIKEFSNTKTRFSRLWGGYKSNREHGKILVEEVKLKVARMDVLTILQGAKDNKQKAKLRNDLNKIVSKEFNVAVKIKKNKYEKLKRKIKKMENELVKRDNEVKKLVKNKNGEVKKRVDDLIKGEEKINWK